MHWMSSWRTYCDHDMWLDERPYKSESAAVDTPQPPHASGTVSCIPTHRQAPAVMGQFEPAHRSWARALRRDIDAQQESLGYTSASARELQKLYVARTLLIKLIRPASGTRSEITLCSSPERVGAAAPN